MALRFDISTSLYKTNCLLPRDAIVHPSAANYKARLSKLQRAHGVRLPYDAEGLGLKTHVDRRWRASAPHTQLRTALLSAVGPPRPSQPIALCRASIAGLSATLLLRKSGHIRSCCPIIAAANLFRVVPGARGPVVSLLQSNIDSPPRQERTMTTKVKRSGGTL